MWDGEFCGSIGFRWQPGTEVLPPHCLGHIGYAVVPWKKRRGHATRALAAMLPLARAEGLGYVELTTDPPQPALTARDRGQRRCAGRMFRQAAAVRQQVGTALPHCAGLKVFSVRVSKQCRRRGRYG